MTWLKRKFRISEVAVAGVFFAVALTIAVSEEVRAAGLGLFRHVADSYLIMFIDTMSLAIVCF
mgnify:CR=1 FL=1